MLTSFSCPRLLWAALRRRLAPQVIGRGIDAALWSQRLGDFGAPAEEEVQGVDRVGDLAVDVYWSSALCDAEGGWNLAAMFRTKKLTLLLGIVLVCGCGSSGSAEVSLPTTSNWFNNTLMTKKPNHIAHVIRTHSNT